MCRSRRCKAPAKSARGGARDLRQQPEAADHSSSLSEVWQAAFSSLGASRGDLTDCRPFPEQPDYRLPVACLGHDAEARVAHQRPLERLSHIVLVTFLAGIASSRCRCDLSKGPLPRIAIQASGLYENPADGGSGESLPGRYHRSNFGSVLTYAGSRCCLADVRNARAG